MGTASRPDRSRLDHLIVQRGLVRTRSTARQLIKDGEILVSGQVETRPARRLCNSTTIGLRRPKQLYVSRGGRKLAAALTHFGLNITDSVVLDVGASTGGFTDCLLQRGAKHVIAVDVGRDQLSSHLREDQRVQSLESTDARCLPTLDPMPEVVVVDLSFIRLRDVLPAIVASVPTAHWALVLLKPQFELPGHEVSRDGVVKDPVAQNRALTDFLEWSHRSGLEVLGTVHSTITGRNGNQEVFALVHLHGPNQNSRDNNYD